MISNLYSVFISNSKLYLESNMDPPAMELMADASNPVTPWYRRERQIINTKAKIIITVICVLVFLVVVHVIYFYSKIK